MIKTLRPILYSLYLQDYSSSLIQRALLASLIIITVSTTIFGALISLYFVYGFQTILILFLSPNEPWLFQKEIFSFEFIFIFSIVIIITLVINLIYVLKEKYEISNYEG
ncbi:MAG: hypothetical protein HeimC3_39300 [Candidatus Heimdallarchaeota archaeon LC_3]|nr:MAG: hypothetical protein HeimC3_39300 [Candidatus Heimdallarchaeota archaeon LC_3]